MSRWRQRVARGTDAGFTLTELLTTMVLLGVVGGMVLTTVLLSYDTINEDRARTDSLNVAATGMNQISRTIRAGTEIQRPGDVARPIFVQARPNRVEMHTWIGERPSKVVYELDTHGNLVERQQMANAASAPNWTFSGPWSERLVARKVPAGSPAVFRYLDATGSVVTLPTTPTESQLRQIASVTVHLTVQTDDTGRAKPAELVNDVGLPNIAVVRR